jgi:hypothetical protein
MNIEELRAKVKELNERYEKWHGKIY